MSGQDRRQQVLGIAAEEFASGGWLVPSGIVNVNAMYDYPRSRGNYG